MTSKIVKCTCTHFMQDEINGPGNRTANETRSGQFRCTVCGTLHGSSSITGAVKAKVEQPVQQKKAVEKKVVEKKKGEKKTVDKKKGEKKTVEKAKSMKGGKR